MCVFYADVNIQGSPFYPKIYDATLVIVGYSEDGLIGENVVFDSTVTPFTFLHATLLSPMYK